MTEDETFDFCEALKRLKEGRRIRRTKWEHKDMHLFIQPKICRHVEWQYKDMRIIMLPLKHNLAPRIYLYMGDISPEHEIIVLWKPLQGDLIGEDWEEVT